MDLSKFKKKHEDEHATTLVHPAGHEIKIAHRQLSPKMREELKSIPISENSGKRVSDSEHVKKMARGGNVKQDGNLKEDDDHPKHDKDEQSKETVGSAIGYPGFPKPKKLAHGSGPIESDSRDEQNSENDENENQNEQAQQPSSPAHTPITINLNSPTGPLPTAQMPAVANVQQPPPVKSPIQPVAYTPDETASTYAPVTRAPESEGQKVIQEGDEKADEAEAAGETPQQMEQAQKASPETLQQPQEGGIPVPDLISSYKGQTGALKDIGETQAKQAETEEQALQNAQKQQQHLINQYAVTRDKLNKEIDSIREDIQNSKIDPEAYWKNHSKIGAAIGLILAGFNPTNQPNAALSYLRGEIDKNIDAQKAELGKKHNLLSALMHQFGNENAAMQMTRFVQTDMLMNKLREAAAHANSPLAKQRAQQLINQLGAQMAPEYNKFTLEQTLEGQKGTQINPNIDPAKLIPILEPNPNEQTKLYKELKEAENMASAKTNAMDAYNKIAELNTLSHNLTSPLQTHRQIAAIKDPLVAELSKATAGRFTEQDAKYLDSLFPKAGSNAETIAENKKHLEKLFDEKMNFPALRGHHLDPSKFNKTAGTQESKLTPHEQMLVALAKQHPKDPKARAFLKKMKIE